MLKFYGHFLKKRNFFAVKFSSLYSDIFFRFGLWHLYWGLVCSKFIWVPIWTNSILLLLLVMLWQSIFQNCGFWGAMCFWGATTCISAYIHNWGQISNSKLEVFMVKNYIMDVNEEIWTVCSKQKGWKSKITRNVITVVSKMHNFDNPYKTIFQ